MSKSGDSLITLAALLGFLWLARWMMVCAAPGPVRFVERLLRHLGSLLLQLISLTPLRRFGGMPVAWFWLVAFALLTGMATLTALCGGNGGAAVAGLGVSLVLWGLVVGSWYLERALARRRYTPRPLPTRQRGRR